MTLSPNVVGCIGPNPDPYPQAFEPNAVALDVMRHKNANVEKSYYYLLGLF